MIIQFEYVCRRCSVQFGDPGVPEIRVTDFKDAETVLQDSLFRNPTAKTRVKLYETHLCAENQIGVGDLAGYKVTEPDEVSTQAPTPARTLSLVRENETGRT